MLFYFTHANIILSFASVISIIVILIYWLSKTEGFAAMANSIACIFASMMLLILLVTYLLTVLSKLRVIYFQSILLLLTVGCIYFSFYPSEFEHLRLFTVLFSIFGILSLAGTFWGGFRRHTI
jgi:hypothetical protein